VELEKPSFDFIPKIDRRPTIPEPPPVRVIAVDDVSLAATAKEATKLDAFYVGLLKFERDEKDASFVYRAENVRLRFAIEESPPKDDMRVLGIEVPSLRDLELLLVDRQLEFIKEAGLFVGQTTFLLQDPAGHWLRLGEVRRIV